MGIHVTDMDRSLQWYRDILGLTLTGRWSQGPDRELAFMRFTDNHHNIVLFTHPGSVDPNATGSYQALHHIAMEIENRDEWLKTLVDLQRKEAEIVWGPLVHGFEVGTGRGTNPGGSGSRSFYFAHPDGNNLELYTEMMKVPDGEQFPRQDYEDLVERVRAERAASGTR